MILALLWNWMVLKILFLNSYSMSTLLLSLDLWRRSVSRSIFILDLSIADLWVLFPRKILKLNSRFWELFILLNAISLDFAKPPFCNFSCTFTYPPSWSYFSGTFLINFFFYMLDQRILGKVLILFTFPLCTVGDFDKWRIYKYHLTM